jgi:lipoate-protein ligase A
MENLTRSLNRKEGKIESRGVQSVRSRVGNISEHLDGSIDMDTFKSCLLDSILEPYGGMRERKLSDKEWENIHRLSEEKYRTWDWNYGKSPECRISRTASFHAGRIDVHLWIKGGIINNIRICGDFSSCRDVEGLEAALTGRRYDIDEIKKVLSSICLPRYFGQLTLDRFADYLCGYSPSEPHL